MRMNVIAILVSLIMLVGTLPVTANSMSIPFDFVLHSVSHNSPKDVGEPDTLSINFSLVDANYSNTVSDGKLIFLNQTYNVKAPKIRFTDVQTKEYGLRWVPETSDSSKATLERYEYTKHTPRCDNPQDYNIIITNIPYNPTNHPTCNDHYMIPIKFVTSTGYVIDRCIEPIWWRG